MTLEQFEQLLIGTKVHVVYGDKSGTEFDAITYGRLPPCWVLLREDTAWIDIHPDMDVHYSMVHIIET